MSFYEIDIPLSRVSRIHVAYQVVMRVYVCLQCVCIFVICLKATKSEKEISLDFAYFFFSVRTKKKLRDGRVNNGEGKRWQLLTFKAFLSASQKLRVDAKFVWKSKQFIKFWCFSQTAQEKSCIFIQKKKLPFHRNANIKCS